VTLELWLFLAMTLLAGAMSPGPSAALVLRTAIRYGRSRALAVALAHGVGISVYALAVVLGLATLIQSSEFMMSALQVGGAVFLLYLGCRMLFGGIKVLTSATREGVNASDHATSKEDDSALGLLQHAINGFLIVFFNPKVVIFFVAIFSQFLSAEHLLSTQVSAAVMAGMIDATWYALVGVLASNQRFSEGLNRAAPFVDSAFGVLFIGFGIVVVLSLH